MSSFLSKLLNHYSLSLEDLEARKALRSFASLTTPFELEDFKGVVKRLKQAVLNKEKTVIYGDYDVDGLTSTTIIYLALKELGLPVGYFIPSRFHEGYGLNEKRVEEFAKKGYHLIVTVDNGITAFSSIALAKKLGMETVVIDHHELTSTLPDTPYVFHQFKSGFLKYNCSAASLSYFVARSLLNRDDEYLATLAGIAVFSDVMPLVGNNLVFARLALSFLNKNRYPNLVSLIGNKESYDYEDFSFSLIPALNSPGRVSKEVMATNNTAKFLMERNNDTVIKKYASEIASLNQQRKDIVKNISFDPSKYLSSDHGEVLYTSQYGGLSGLFANKAMREKKVPVAVFSLDDTDPENLVGSLRAPDPYRVDVFLSQNPQLFISCGGHSKAAGLKIKKKDYFKVATAFLSECEKQSLENNQVSEEHISLDLEDLNEDNYRTLEEFMPFGEGFEAPLFSLSLGRENLVFSQNGNAAFSYSPDKKSKLFFYGDIKPLKDEHYSYYVFVGQFRKETFQGKVSYSLFSTNFDSQI
ncbi:MAG: DHH family phosphoesterase [Bacilli bacterium]